MSSKNSESIAKKIRDVHDFPKKGIVFKDITPVFSDIDLFRKSIDLMVKPFIEKKIDVVVGIESRGFIFGTPIADMLNASFVPVRKPGKLPYDAYSVEYDLEYGSNTLEMHVDSLHEGQNVVIIDDLLATGGTVAACVELCQRAGANPIASLFVIELEGLGARELLNSIPIHALIEFPA